jgi:branched-chain amino acid transport system ATP-binding protein
MGRNGMGKTTAISTIIGFSPPRRGEIYFKGKSLVGLQPYQIAQMGIGLIPQGRQIFASLSVAENLTMAARGKGWTLDKIYQLFPILKERASCKGTLLSGGEQQMLTIARALMTNPELLLMDEPSEGLAPIIVSEVGHIIGGLKQRGFSILLVEQNLSLVLGVADYVYIISKGSIVYQSTPGELRNNEEVQGEYLGISNK